MILFAYAAMLISPVFFSTNVVFGRAATDIAPFLLAFIRWGLSGMILLLLCRNRWPQMLSIARAHWPTLTLLGFLGMFICGGIVYLALRTTTATNGILIYTAPPIIIILIERFWRQRPLKWRENLGITLAIFGVVVIVAKGSLQTILTLDFNSGDLLFVLAAVSWAIYSVVLKSRIFANLGTLPLFALVALFGAATLFPFALWEIIEGNASARPPPATGRLSAALCSSLRSSPFPPSSMASRFWVPPSRASSCICCRPSASALPGCFWARLYKDFIWRALPPS